MSTSNNVDLLKVDGRLSEPFNHQPSTRQPIMSNARVTDITAVRAFKVALVEFEEEASSTLEMMQMQLHRLIDWVEHEQPAYWTKQIQIGFEKDLAGPDGVVDMPDANGRRASTRVHRRETGTRQGQTTLAVLSGDDPSREAMVGQTDGRIRRVSWTDSSLRPCGRDGPATNDRPDRTHCCLTRTLCRGRQHTLTRRHSASNFFDRTFQIDIS